MDLIRQLYNRFLYHYLNCPNQINSPWWVMNTDPNNSCTRLMGIYCLWHNAGEPHRFRFHNTGHGLQLLMWSSVNRMIGTSQHHPSCTRYIRHPVYSVRLLDLIGCNCLRDGWWLDNYILQLCGCFLFLLVILILLRWLVRKISLDLCRLHLHLRCLHHWLLLVLSWILFLSLYFQLGHRYNYRWLFGF